MREAKRTLQVTLPARDDGTNNEDDFERLLNMAENLPDDYEEKSRPSRGEIEAESDRKHDAMVMLASAQLWPNIHGLVHWHKAENGGPLPESGHCFWRLQFGHAGRI